VTTYWAVGTLTSFNGSEWLPVSGVSGALSGSAGSVATSLGPATLPAPKPAQTFAASVAITDFASRLLPAPPDTLAVHGLVGAAAIDEEGVLAATASTAGTSYTVTAGLHETIPSDARQLASTDPRLAPYLALPAQPAIVSRLARQAVGDATTPAAEAQALVNWFRSGQFRYTLSPPATTGPDPLVQFLTVTKAGFCEQFAGAYGVLARELGIPTRLVVGFTPGRAGPGDSFTVTGANAHVWPQVYLGPSVGWISVEPTPPVPGTPTAPGVVGASTSASPPAGASTATSSPTTVPASAPSAVPARSSGSGLGAHHRGHVPQRRGSTWWVAAVVVVGLLVLAALAVWAVRRRRSAVEARLRPDQGVVRAWDQALAALRRTGMARREEETPAEYAARVHRVEHSSEQPMGAGAVMNLATLVELACYRPRPCTPAEAERARTLASTIVATNRSQRRQPRAPAAWN
jgi:transglutaminase-like putative cysteine protease